MIRGRLEQDEKRSCACYRFTHLGPA